MDNHTFSSHSPPAQLLLEEPTLPAPSETGAVTDLSHRSSWQARACSAHLAESGCQWGLALAGLQSAGPELAVAWAPTVRVRRGGLVALGKHTRGVGLVLRAPIPTNR